MPLFMDRHDIPGVTPEQVAQAHLVDLAVEIAVDERHVDVVERAALRVRGPRALLEAPLPGCACAAFGCHSGNVARQALAQVIGRDPGDKKASHG